MSARTQTAGQFSHRQPANPPRLPHLPGLDGLRAIAVIAVLLYHADIGWLRGGFLGVEVFFVISGYLITSLLLAEWRQTGRIDLARFWLRRARRLLPALYVMLVLVLAYATLFLSRDVARLRGDALAAFGYVTNWYLALRQQSYFEAVGRPSPLLHLWSLAIEEQFYLLWPPILAFALRRWSPQRIAAATAATAAASTLLMALLYRPDLDPSAIYYRTDTRLGGLLIGAALAFAWQPWLHRDRPIGAHRARYEAAGLTAIAALLFFCLIFGEATPFLYRGGFLLVALTTAAAIATLVAPQGRSIAALLDSAPLRWAGTRSYSLYLWHWPVYVVTRPRIDLAFDGLPVLALRLLLAGILAELSYRCVEQPIRHELLTQAWQQLQAARGTLGLVWRVYLAVGILLLTLLGTTVTLAHQPPPELPNSVVIDSPEEPTATEVALAGTDPATEPSASEPAPTAALTPVAVAPTAVPVRPTSAFKPASRVTAVGDSVMVGVADDLDAAIKGQLYLDAAIGRLPSEGIAILEDLRDRGRLGQVVIVHLGNNGYFADGEVEAMMDILAEVRLVVIINVRVPRDWEGTNNSLLEHARHRPNAVMVDWHGLTNDHPDLFGDDGIHPNGIGRELYTRMVAKWANEPIIPPNTGRITHTETAYAPSSSTAPSSAAPARARSIGPLGASTKLPAGVRKTSPTQAKPALRMPRAEAALCGSWPIQAQTSSPSARRIAWSSRG
jgi:peptidoglycan/LPS O-acetylase OafA/YrhL